MAVVVVVVIDNVVVDDVVGGEGFVVASWTPRRGVDEPADEVTRRHWVAYNVHPIEGVLLAALGVLGRDHHF